MRLNSHLSLGEFSLIYMIQVNGLSASACPPNIFTIHILSVSVCCFHFGIRCCVAIAIRTT